MNNVELGVINDWLDTGKISVTYKFLFFWDKVPLHSQMIIGLLVKSILQRLAFKFSFLGENKHTNKKMCLNDSIYPILCRNKLLYRNKN